MNIIISTQNWPRVARSLGKATEPVAYSHYNVASLF